jgi:SAM-dependent methyltransferase
MSFIKKNRLIRKIFAFNPTNRDAWIKAQSSQVESGSDVLDIGAGSCPYRSYFAHCNYLTQDFVQLLPGQLRDGSYGKIDYVCDSAQIPVPDASFDVVLCTEVLEHHPEPIKVVREFARVLRPQGRLLLTAPLGSGIHQEPFHYYGGYTPYWYEKYLKAAGFEEIEIQANGGFFRHFGQESLRFVQLSRPTAMKSNLPLVIAWTPFWLLSVIILGVLMPIICALLDPLDHEQRFTVGYHVKAKLSKVN